MPKLWTKTALFGYFWDRILKSYCHISNHHPQICQFAKFREKIKMPNLGPKVPYFGIFRLEFLKTIIIFEISTLKFVNLQNFAKK